MPGLLSLPNELLQQILSDLYPEALLNISLVSPLFNRLAEPFLFGSLGGYEGWLLPRLSAIVARPHLARLVRRIEFGWLASRNPSPDKCALFSATAEQLGIEDIGWWADAQALFLLQLALDVRELSFSQSPLLCRFIENTLSTPLASLPFKSLVKFECDEYTQHSSVTLTLLLALMRLPSLRHLTADMEAPRYYTHDPSVIDDIVAFAGQSPLTHLSLHYGNMSTSVLAQILQLPRALTHLSYSDDQQYSYVADPVLLQTALRCVRPTLQSLTLGPLNALRLGKPGAQAIGALCDWPALTKVKCAMATLVGTVTDSTGRLVDVLPMGLRVLEIRRAGAQRARLKIRDYWPVADMTEQLVEVLQNRAVERMTVGTDAGAYDLEGGWANPFEEDVKRRLEEAVGTGCCRIVCT